MDSKTNLKQRRLVLFLMDFNGIEFSVVDSFSIESLGNSIWNYLDNGYDVLKIQEVLE